MIHHHLACRALTNLVIFSDLVRIFLATKLQLLLNGLPDINVKDCRANTELHQFQQSDSTVTWFWRAVRSFGQEERTKLLQFTTGSSRVPLKGFGALQGAQGANKVTDSSMIASSLFEASLYWNANALLRTNVALLRNATGMKNKSLEASEIPKWLASLLLFVEAISAYAKDKPASDIELSRPVADDLDENDNDDDEENEEVNNPIAESVAFLGFPALINEPCQETASQTASTLAPKSVKSGEPSSLAFAAPSKEDLELVFKICTNVLRFQQCGRHNFLADIRVLLILTQKHSVAKAFLNSDACPILPFYFVIPLNQTRSNKQSWPKRLFTSFPLMAVPDNPIYLLFADICFPWPGKIGQPGWRQSLKLANLFPTMALRWGSWLIALDDKKDQKTQESKNESNNSTLKISSGETASSEMQID
ncbi:hypothetical protein VP01_3628g3 [Puccinia sorghi]|uniref:HECT-type E3 ubiquitin transferase n=1 Tax=Puccinia sorghi TaxID=27349 RepID=A0A0L6UUT0_9BASI|nr:hypothetical protein VP01_3628g3 [Puccinia sorghi]